MPEGARDLIVIGGSAGAVEVLRTVLACLPVDLGAAVAVTIHRHPTRPSTLDRVLGRRSSLPVTEPVGEEPLTPGRVYLAPPDRHMTIAGDAVRLNRDPRQHHTRPAIEAIRLAGAPCPGGVVICVEDDGTGIAPRDLPRIFEPLFSTKGSQGMGMGLATAAALMRRLRGTISARNRNGGGACIALTFVDPDLLDPDRA